MMCAGPLHGLTSLRHVNITCGLHVATGDLLDECVCLHGRNKSMWRSRI